MTPQAQIFNADCYDLLPTLTQRIDLIVTDPPYALRNSDDRRSKLAGRVNRVMDNLADINSAKSLNIPRLAELAETLRHGDINAYFFCNALQVPEYCRTAYQRIKNITQCSTSE